MSLKNYSFERRKKRVRAKIKKHSNRVRLSIFKSSRHIYAQIIDDLVAKTIVSASTLDRTIKSAVRANYCNIDNAIKVGKLIAERASKKGIKSVILDRGGYKYYGNIKALADEARKILNF